MLRRYRTDGRRGGPVWDDDPDSRRIRRLANRLRRFSVSTEARHLQKVTLRRPDHEARRVLRDQDWSDHYRVCVTK